MGNYLSVANKHIVNNLHHKPHLLLKKKKRVKGLILVVSLFFRPKTLDYLNLIFVDCISTNDMQREILENQCFYHPIASPR